MEREPENLRPIRAEERPKEGPALNALSDAYGNTFANPTSDPTKCRNIRYTLGFGRYVKASSTPMTAPIAIPATVAARVGKQAADARASRERVRVRAV